MGYTMQRQTAWSGLPQTYMELHSPVNYPFNASLSPPAYLLSLRPVSWICKLHGPILRERLCGTVNVARPTHAIGVTKFDHDNTRNQDSSIPQTCALGFTKHRETSCHTTPKIERAQTPQKRGRWSHGRSGAEQSSRRSATVSAGERPERITTPIDS